MSVFGVSSSVQAAVPAPSFNRVFKLFFSNEMSRRTDTHCQQGKNTGPRTPPRVGWEQKMNTKAGGEEGRIHPLSVWRGVSKKNVIHQADFLAGILRCSAHDLFEYLMCFYSVFLYFCDITMFRAKKDSSYKHPDFYANPIHPSPLP
jgi:hypothetical protein